MKKTLALIAALAATPALAEDRHPVEDAFDQAIAILAAVEPCQLRNDDPRYANLGGNDPQKMLHQMGAYMEWDRQKVIDEYVARFNAETQSLVKDMPGRCAAARAFLATLDDAAIATFSTMN